MEHKLTIASIALYAAAAVGVAIPMLIAIEVIPTRWYGVGHFGLTASIALYVRRQVCRVVSQREAVAFKMGQASAERGLALVRSLD